MRAREDQRLLGLIKHHWLASGTVYGYRKITLDLREAGETCSRHRVRRLMQTEGLRAQVGYGSKPRFVGPEERSDQAADLTNAGHSRLRCLRLHRDVLQPEPIAPPPPAGSQLSKRCRRRPVCGLPHQRHRHGHGLPLHRRWRDSHKLDR